MHFRQVILWENSGAPLAYLVASETSAFATPVRHLRDVRAGEIVLVS